MRKYFLLILVITAAITSSAAQAGQRGDARSSGGSADLDVEVLATTAATIDPSTRPSHDPEREFETGVRAHLQCGRQRLQRWTRYGTDGNVWA